MLVKTLSETKVSGAVQREGHMGYWRNYFGAASQLGKGPQAFMVVVPPNGMTRAHFHQINQYQVFFGTPGATFQRKAVSPVYVHYVDGFTPYGPFTGGTEGMEFFTLRAVASKGLWYMPDSREKLVHKAGRSLHIEVPQHGVKAGVELTALFEPYADGLAAWSVNVGPEQDFTGPAPVKCGGQYCLITKGTAQQGERGLPEKSALFVGEGEGPIQLSALGTLGFQALMVQYPAGPQTRS